MGEMYSGMPIEEAERRIFIMRFQLVNCTSQEKAAVLQYRISYLERHVEYARSRQNHDAHEGSQNPVRE